MGIFPRAGVLLFAGALTMGVGASNFSLAQTGAAPSTAAVLNDRGNFAISFDGHLLGMEKFNIRSFPDRIEAEGEIELKTEQGGQNIDLKTYPHLILNPQFEPQTYEVSRKGAQPFHLEVDFRTSPAKSLLRLATSKQDDERDFALPKDVVILDDNVVHHYQILVNHYAMKPEKKQTFKAYIPQEALPGDLIMEEVGTEIVELAGQKETLRHLIVGTDLAQIDLWVDVQNHLQRVLIPAMQLEAVRVK
jgi:hypothetical protein